MSGRSWFHGQRPGRRVPVVTVYTRDACGLCRTAEDIVAREARRARVELVDIDADEQLQRRYNVRVPVVAVDGVEVAEGRLAPGVVRRAIGRARRR